MPYSHLLVAVAPTPESRVLIQKAVSIARPVNAKVSLITLATDPELYNQFAAPMMENLREVMQEETRGFLAELARHHCAAQAFICGPGSYMDAAVAALQAVEMPSERIHVERFASLPDEETLAAANAMAQAAPPLPGAVDEAVVEVLLDGQTHTLHCSGNETLLEAALKAGLNAPYSCQAGMCASCMCQVIEGSVHLRHNDVLDKKDLAKAWTLACQAVPTSERLRIKFPE